MKVCAGILAFVTVAYLPACTGRSEDPYADLAHFEVVEERRIGSVEDPDEGFSEIGGVAVDSEGLIYVLERGDRTVRVYDRSGHLVRTIGRAGEGPGEFRLPMLLGMLGDTLWVNDVGLSRITFFSGDGAVLRIVSPKPTSIQTSTGLEVQLTAGVPRSANLFSSGWRVQIPENPPLDSFTIPIVRMDSAGTIVDTIFQRPWALSARRLLSVGNALIPLPDGPSASPRYLETPNGSYVVQWSTVQSSGGAVFVVSRIAGLTDTLFSRTLRYQPRPYNQESVERFLRPALAPFIMSTGLDTAAVVAAVAREMEWPSLQAPIIDGQVGRDTVLWLKLDGPARDVDQWILISPEGEPLGKLFLDSGATVLWSNGDEVWTARRDEFDVPWLIKYRLRGFG